MWNLETIKDLSEKPPLKKKSIAKFINFKENFDLSDIWKLFKISLINSLWKKKMYSLIYQISRKFLFERYLERIKDFPHKTTVKKKSIGKFIGFRENIEFCDI